MDHVAGGCSKLTQKEYKEGMIVHWKLARKCGNLLESVIFGNYLTGFTAIVEFWKSMNYHGIL